MCQLRAHSEIKVLLQTPQGTEVRIQLGPLARLSIFCYLVLLPSLLFLRTLTQDSPFQSLHQEKLRITMVVNKYGNSRRSLGVLVG